MIEARAVSVSRRLDDVDLRVIRGELCAVVGPNGAGKSTLLGLLAGDVTPDAGSLHFQGEELRRRDRLALARRRAVVLQQAPAPFPLTVHEVVALGRLPHGDERRADPIVARALDAVGLTAFADRTYPTLSGGERQRVQVARALAQIDGVDGPALLLDEPTAAADLAWQERLLALLRARADAGACVVIVLHDLNLAARWAHSVVVLARGRVAAHGPPDAALDEALLSAAWGVRFLRGRVAGHSVLLPSLESA